MSAEQFLLCFRRFIAKRGRPVQVISDNAPHFKVTKSAIDMVWKDVKNYAANNNIRWTFIVEYAPWMGGFYERLVGSVKRALKKGIGKLRLSFDQLMTILTEVEAAINSRPLVYVGSDLDSYRCISPADFLSLNPKSGVPELIVDDNSDDDEYLPYLSSSENLLISWKKGQKHVQLVWDIWQEDYLLSLRERTQTQHKNPRIQAHSIPQIGDVVLIKQKNMPRGTWKLGRIKALIRSEDEEIRGAEVQLPSKRVLVRPVSLLYPVECSKTDNEDTNQAEPCDEKTEQIPTIVPDQEARPLREAAKEARRKIADLLF